MYVYLNNHLGSAYDEMLTKIQVNKCYTMLLN